MDKKKNKKDLVKDSKHLTKNEIKKIHKLADAIKDDYANEILALSKELDKNKVAYTTNQEIAKAYQKNANPYKKFKVTKEGDKYKIVVLDSIKDSDALRQLADEFLQKARVFERGNLASSRKYLGENDNKDYMDLIQIAIKVKKQLEKEIQGMKSSGLKYRQGNSQEPMLDKLRDANSLLYWASDYVNSKEKKYGKKLADEIDELSKHYQYFMKFGDSKVKDKFDIKVGAIFKERESLGSKRISQDVDAYYIKVKKIDNDKVWLQGYQRKDGKNLVSTESTTMSMKSFIGLLEGRYAQVQSFYDSKVKDTYVWGKKNGKWIIVGGVYPDENRYKAVLEKWKNGEIYQEYEDLRINKDNKKPKDSVKDAETPRDIALNLSRWMYNLCIPLSSVKHKSDMLEALSKFQRELEKEIKSIILEGRKKQIELLELNSKYIPDSKVKDYIIKFHSQEAEDLLGKKAKVLRVTDESDKKFLNQIGKIWSIGGDRYVENVDISFDHLEGRRSGNFDLDDVEIIGYKKDSKPKDSLKPFKVNGRIVRAKDEMDAVKRYRKVRDEEKKLKVEFDENGNAKFGKEWGQSGVVKVIAKKDNGNGKYIAVCEAKGTGQKYFVATDYANDKKIPSDTKWFKKEKDAMQWYKELIKSQR